MNKRLLLPLVFIISISFSSCKKYEDGGNSFRIENKIFKNVWVIENVLFSGNGTLERTFNDDGTTSVNISYLDSTIHVTETWKLNDKKTEIQIDEINHIIEKISDDEFWISYEEEIDPIVLEYNPDKEPSRHTIKMNAK
jgi:adenylate cyclase